MIIFEQTLRQLLTDTNLVGTRVFLVRAPQVPASQAVNPYIVFFPVGPIDPQASETQRGPIDQITRLYQISIFDNSQTRALAIADSLRQYLDGYSGNYENVHIGHIFHVTQTVTWETDTRLYQVIAEYRIMFRWLTYDPPATPTRSNNRNTGEKSNVHTRTDTDPARRDASTTAARS
jgi:hypothetical protein